MRRLVVAGTSLLVLLGAAVVASYLLLVGASADRAARAAPADTALYVNAYLQPSSGQQASLFALIGRLPGFGDPAALDGKIDEIAQRLLGEAGIDYAADLRPWLGDQIALAAVPGTGDSGPGVVLLAAVKDSPSARAGVPRLLAASGVSFTKDEFRGREVMTSAGTSYALLDDLLIVASTPERLHASLEADADLAPSLADSAAFGAAINDVAIDHLASVYLNLPRSLGLGEGATVGGFRTAALAITAAADGLRIDGSAPFAADAAGEAARTAFAMGSRTPTLADWMPRSTAAGATIFGLAQSFQDLESSLGTVDAFAPAADALNQLRAIAALGLGVNVDRDLFPLLDGEVAFALERIDYDGPHGQLLLRPTDPAAAQTSLNRVRTALSDRGSRVTMSEVAGTTVTTVAVPQIGTVAYAILDGVVVLGLDPAEVAAALEAHATGRTLGGDDRYRAAFELAGERAGNEFWADLPSLVDALATIFDPGAELRDILHQIGELAVTATAVDDRLEIHGVLTVK